MNRDLWPHQVEAMESLRQTIKQGIRRIVLSAPTGSGKTLLSAAIVEGALTKGNRVAFVVSNLSLIDQSVEAMYAEGIRGISVIQANHEMQDWSRPVQICSIQTIKSRKAFPEAQIVIIDEVHVLHACHKEWLQHPDWQRIPFIGLSATPYTKGLGKYFETMIVVSTTQELIDKKILSPFIVLGSGHPDLSGVKTVAGDYHEAQLSEAMQKGGLTADIVTTWLDKWGKDKTLFFGVDCAHSQAVQQRFIEAGVTCGYQDARTPADERREIRRKFHNGEYQVVSNVATLTTGTDWDCRCLILGRPTKSEMLYQQIIGRALRVAPGKDKALILDHSDTTQRLGFVTDIYHDHLDSGKEATVAEPKKRLPKPCPQCTAMIAKVNKVCPNCGFEIKIVSGVVEDDGQLVELTGGLRQKKGAKRVYTMEQKAVFLAGLKAYARQYGRANGWCAHSFKEKFGMWPDWSIKDIAPATYPNMEIMMWVKSRNIAYAKRKAREAKEQHV